MKNIALLIIALSFFLNSFAQTSGLKETYKDFFPIGAAIGKSHLLDQDALLLKTHFSSITAENDMKPERIIQKGETYTFEAGDSLVDFARKNNMLVRGHTLVWYYQTEDWFYHNDEGKLLDKPQMLSRMKRYINMVLDHYKGKIYAWDVVNEAISDNPDKLYRDNIDWFKICGSDYIEMAFRYAHEADPDVKLFYNDYNLINPVKRQKVYQMIKALLEKGVPVHGVGMQGHWTLEDVNRKNLSESIELFSSLGLDVQITELDISVYPHYHGIERSLLPKEIIPFSKELDEKLANKYQEVFEVLREKKDKITGVTFWGVADNKTWLSQHVVKGRTDYPLLFDANYQPKKAFYAVTDIKLKTLNSIENNKVKISVNEQGAIQFFDKEKGVNWGNKLPGWIEIYDEDKTIKIPLQKTVIKSEIKGETLHISFSNLKNEEICDLEFEMQVKLILGENHVDIEIEKLYCSYPLSSIEYPAHILSVKSGVENGYLAVPHLQGIVIPSRYDAGFMRFGQNVWKAISDTEDWWTFESGNLNMPWFGAVKENSTAMVYVQTSSDCMLHLIGNKLVKNNGIAVVDKKGHIPGERMSSNSPIWLASHREFSYARKMRIELVDNGYVGMTKRYKEYAKKSGRYVTLKEKIEKNPNYEKIIGAPDLKVYCYTNRLNNPNLRAWCEPVLNGYEKVNTTFDQVTEMSDDLKELGVEKCMFLLGGWNRLGYDRQHVDMWPPAEKAGGIEGLKKAAESVTKNGYLFALHDNYDDYYTDAPTFDENYILRDADGAMHQGGIWDGGICYITCPAQRAGLLNRNMDLIQNDIPLNAYYFDVITSSPHYECYDKRHPITRKEDLKYRLKLLQNITERGFLIGGERGTDWALPALAFCEGLSGGGTGFHRGVTYDVGITIPLFYLVYHECVVGYWQHGTPAGREDHANHVLLDLICAQPSSWSITYNQWADLKPLFKETYDLLNPLHEITAHAAMVNHEVLSGDYMVQKSVFENGTKVWVNYGITTHKTDILEIPPKGFKINYPDGRVVSGNLSRSIHVN